MRAGISLEKPAFPAKSQAAPLCLKCAMGRGAISPLPARRSPTAEAARRLPWRTAAQRAIPFAAFGLGYAPLAGRLAGAAGPAGGGQALDLLEQVGLIASRPEGRLLRPFSRPGHVSDPGRARPNGGVRRTDFAASPLSGQVPKYYNSSDTPLFSKSEQLYGIDQARQAGSQAGYLAVVEGYTDVLMAHQMGIPQVVATMGTALNAAHVRQLRRFVPRVVLVFDADAGGETGVDRALEVFVSQDLDLAWPRCRRDSTRATCWWRRTGAVPDGLDNAVDVLEFKLQQRAGRRGPGDGVEGRRRAIDAVLGVIALAPDMPGQAGRSRRELMVNRIAQRLGLKEETLWARLGNCAAATRRVGEDGNRQRRGAPQKPAEQPRRRRWNADLLQVLLAEPRWCPRRPGRDGGRATSSIPGCGGCWKGFIGCTRRAVCRPGSPAGADRQPATGASGPEVAGTGPAVTGPCGLAAANPGGISRTPAGAAEKRELQNQLQAAIDHASAMELLRQLQNRNEFGRSAFDRLADRLRPSSHD